MRVSRPLLASYAAMAASTALPLLAMPLCAAALGPKGWGLASYAFLLQLVVTLIEQGFSQALVKEMAGVRLSRKGEFRPLLKGLERFYGLAVIGVATCVPMASHVLAIGVAERSDLDVGLARQVVLLSGLLIAVQLPGALYRSALIASEWHVANSLWIIVAQSLRHGGGIAVAVMFGRPELYLIWMVTVALIETVGRRSVLLWLVSREACAQVPTLHDGDAGAGPRIEVKDVIRRSAKMSLAVLLGSLAVYMDRFIVGQKLPVESLGIYTLASTAAIGVTQLVYPICQLNLPKLVQARENREARWSINQKMLLQMLAMVLVAGGLYTAIGMHVVGWWLKSDALILQVAPLLPWLLLGSALNALYNVGYLNWIADGNHSAIMKVYGFCLVAGLAIVPWSIEKYGLSGAVVGWLLINTICFLSSFQWVLNGWRHGHH